MSSTPIKRGRRQQKISSSDSVSKWEKALTKNAKWSKNYTQYSVFFGKYYLYAVALSGELVLSKAMLDL